MSLALVVLPTTRDQFGKSTEAVLEGLLEVLKLEMEVREMARLEDVPDDAEVAVMDLIDMWTSFGESLSLVRRDVPPEVLN